MERKTITYTFHWLFFGFLFLVPIHVFSASLSFSPGSGTFQVGDRVTVRVMVSSNSPINAISSSVAIPTSFFSVESVSKTGSILNFWITEPNFSKSTGILSFEGVTTGGFTGGTGGVATVVLRALRDGSGTLSFVSGQVLANDGQGTDVTGALNKAVFLIEPKKETVELPRPEAEPELEREMEVIENNLPSQELALRAPEIVLAKRLGQDVIIGSSDYPKAQVLLTFLSNTGVKVFVMGETDDEGDFLFSIPNTLKSGEYKISAVIIQKDLTYSPPSNEVETGIGSIFSDIGTGVKIAILVLFIILLYLFIRSYFIFIKDKKEKEYIDEETDEAKDILHKSFKVLSSDVKREIKNNGEKESLKSLKEDLDDAEEIISKEIEDIRKSSK